MSKEFEEWAISVDLNPVPYSDTHRAAYLAWKARQPEIDALKAENERLKEEIEDLNSHLIGCQEQLNGGEP